MAFKRRLAFASIISFGVLGLGGANAYDASGLVACSTSQDCVEAHLGGYFCAFGRCTSNPYEQGCLYREIPGWNQKRICNSDDPVDAAELGICRRSSFDHLELRIFTQNWESAFFESWLLQIILSEILDVPTTLETGLPDAKLNLYDPQSPFDYGMSNLYGALESAHTLKDNDCRLASRDPESYEPCAHVIPEIWSVFQHDAMNKYLESGVMQQTLDLSAIGTQFWFIPKFTAVRDPTLVSYMGLQGEKNRRKLAETFLRPTNWKDYCDLVSINNCETADGVAERAPQGKTEESRMYVEGLYTGHFRKTEKNDCDKYPHNCTGHIADYPCDWTSYVKQQTYWLGIALESDGPEPGSGGYFYSQLTEMWAAANATKSNLIMVWWTPQILYNQHFGSDSAFMRVILPPPTQQCVKSRTSIKDKCSDDQTVRAGKSEGSCDEVPVSLQRALVADLREISNDASVQESLRSPAYDVLNLLSINSFQMGELFDYWEAINDPRAAVCRWAVDNYEFISQTVPRSYPRVLLHRQNRTLKIASLVLGGFALAMVLWALFTMYRQRKRRIILFAQVEFMCLLLIGLLFISFGAMLGGLQQTDTSCKLVTFFVNFGYSFELIPLIVKMAAVDRLFRAAQNLRRVVLRRVELLRSVLLISTIVIVYLTVWLVVDTPRTELEYILTEETTEEGATIVYYQYSCISNSMVWYYVSVAWYAALLLAATLLAYQTRTMRQDFNESQTLAIMIYSHCLFVVLRLITIFLSRTFSKADVTKFQSMIFSIDTIVTILIYFVPKFVSIDDENALRMPSMSQVNRWLGVSHFTAALDNSIEIVFAPSASQHKSQHGGNEDSPSSLPLEITRNISSEPDDRQERTTLTEGPEETSCLKNPQEDSSCGDIRSESSQ